MATVEIVHWNARRALGRGRIGRRLKVGKRENNFGDLIGPIVVRKVLESRGWDLKKRVGSRRRLLTVGSIMHFASTGDIVWGAGVNGKVRVEKHRFTDLDVRAVRGPKTAAFLRNRGIDCPDVFGDPALLLVELDPRLRDWAAMPKLYDVSVIPNLHDFRTMADRHTTIDPTSPVESILERIARSERVVGSSLHAIILAESIGIPAFLVTPSVESMFKYEDYFLGSGRTRVYQSESIEAALIAEPAPPIVWSPQPLLEAFPWDLWE